MSIIDKIKKWTDADDYDDEDEFEEYVPQNTALDNRPAQSVSGNTTTYDQPSVSPYTRGNKVVNINATAQLQVVLVKPVVINLEQTNKDIARRLLDFLSGVAYAYQGKFQKIANSTFLITPYNVGIMGDIIDELESNGLYF